MRRSRGIADAATLRFSSTVSVPKSSSRWNVRPRPSLTRLCTGIDVMSFVPSITRPEVGLRTPVITLKRVVFPAPFGPINEVIPPETASSPTSLRTVLPPKRTVTSVTSRSTADPRGNAESIVEVGQVIGTKGKALSELFGRGTEATLGRCGARRGGQRPSRTSTENRHDDDERHTRTGEEPVGDQVSERGQVHAGQHS